MGDVEVWTGGEGVAGGDGLVALVLGAGNTGVAAFTKVVLEAEMDVDPVPGVSIFPGENKGRGLEDGPAFPGITRGARETGRDPEVAAALSFKEGFWGIDLALLAQAFLQWI